MSKLKFSKIRVNGDMKFNDLSDESFRSYIFPKGTVTIPNPVALHVSNSGSHYVIDGGGKAHCIPTGWIELIWDSSHNDYHIAW